jgi:hypothetical protein
MALFQITWVCHTVTENINPQIEIITSSGFISDPALGWFRSKGNQVTDSSLLLLNCQKKSFTTRVIKKVYAQGQSFYAISEKKEGSLLFTRHGAFCRIENSL